VNLWPEISYEQLVVIAWVQSTFPLATVTLRGSWLEIVMEDFSMTVGSTTDAVLPLSTRATSFWFPKCRNRGNVVAWEEVPESACSDIYSSGLPSAVVVSSWMTLSVFSSSLVSSSCMDIKWAWFLNLQTLLCSGTHGSLHLKHLHFPHRVGILGLSSGLSVFSCRRLLDKDAPLEFYL
jgi:hypothetical protein